jgi:Transposase IS66 family
LSAFRVDPRDVGGDQLNRLVVGEVVVHPPQDRGLVLWHRQALRRFGRHRDMILRFSVNLDVPFTNNTAELAARAVKVQQRTSGGGLTPRHVG